MSCQWLYVCPKQSDTMQTPLCIFNQQPLSNWSVNLHFSQSHWFIWSQCGWGISVSLNPHTGFGLGVETLPGLISFCLRLVVTNKLGLCTGWNIWKAIPPLKSLKLALFPMTSRGRHLCVDKKTRAVTSANTFLTICLFSVSGIFFLV